MEDSLFGHNEGRGEEVLWWVVYNKDISDKKLDSQLKSRHNFRMHLRRVDYNPGQTASSAKKEPLRFDE